MVEVESYELTCPVIDGRLILPDNGSFSSGDGMMWGSNEDHPFRRPP